MMKQYIFFLMIAQITLITAKHQLVTIYNDSDLKFEYAYHMDHGKEKKKPILTEKLQKSSKNNKKHVFMNQHKIHGKGLSIRMVDPFGHVYDFHCDDQLILSIVHNRKSTQKIANFPQSCNNGHYCARAILEHTKTKKQLASAAHGHDYDEILNLRISGKSGNYKLSYEQAY
jgi:hypothetical protein